MKASYYIAAVCSAACSIALWLSPLGKTVENATVDFYLAKTAPHVASDDIVIVAIDEASFGSFSLPWPWPRSMHAELIERLLDAGAAAVVFDIVFSEPTSPEADQAFKSALGKAGSRVVLGAELNLVDDPHFTRQILVTPLPEFTAAGASTGYINVQLDDDGFVRRMAPLLDNKETLAQAAVRLLHSHLGTVGEAISDVPNSLIHFLGCPRTITTVSYYEALQLQSHLREGFFKDKLVFVGLATSINEISKQVVQDAFLTPFSRQDGGYMAGVEIQANIAENLLSGSAIKQVPPRVLQACVLLLGLVLTLLFFAMSPIRGCMLWLALGGAACVLSWQGIFSLRLYVSPWLLLLPQTVSFLISIIVQYARTWQERNFIRRVFSTYLSPKVVERLLDQPGYLALGGEHIEGSVLFLDIVGFSLIAEEVSPQVLVQIVNRCLGVLSTEVFASDGMIDKFIGDSIMAVWGAPFAVPEHGLRAVRTALGMQRRMVELSAAERKLSGADISVRIGVSSGSMVAGNVGDSSYVNYTVLGSTVNIASRLEGLCKVYGVRTLISESTALLLPADVFVIRELDLVMAKGLGQKTRIFELQGEKGGIPDSQLEVNRLFAAGRSAYFAERFTEAVDYFNQALALDSNDGPSAVFLKRAEAYAEDPPTGWDGIFRAAEK